MGKIKKLIINLFIFISFIFFFFFGKHKSNVVVVVRSCGYNLRKLVIISVDSFDVYFWEMVGERNVNRLIKNFNIFIRERSRAGLSLLWPTSPPTARLPSSP